MVITMIIVTSISLLVLCGLIGFLVLKAYTLGLKHSYELKHDTKPTEPKNIIQYVVDKKQEKQEDEQAREDANIMSEWLHGAKRE